MNAPIHPSAVGIRLIVRALSRLHERTRYRLMFHPPPTKRTSRRVSRFPGARGISRQSDDASRVVAQCPSLDRNREWLECAYDRRNTFLLQTAPPPERGVDGIYTRTRAAGIQQPNVFPSTIRARRRSLPPILSLLLLFKRSARSDTRDIRGGRGERRMREHQQAEQEAERGRPAPSNHLRSIFHSRNSAQSPSM